MFTVDGNKVKVEFSSSLGLRVLEDDLEMSGFLISLKSDLIVVVSQFHNLSQVCDGDTQYHVSVSTIVLKAVHGKVK